MRDRLPVLVRFLGIGAIGFVVDSAGLYALLAAGMGLITGRLISFLIAATATWVLHRKITFRTQTRPSVKEWLRFLISNALGGGANLGVYSLLVTQFALFRTLPVLAVAIGAAGAIAINFALSNRFVFRD